MSRLPFGGVPMGIKELESVEGWPFTEASLVFADRVGDYTTTHVDRLRASGRSPGRPDDGQRVRRHQRHPHQAARHHPQPLEPRAHPGRVLGRFGRGGGRAGSCPSRRAVTVEDQSASPPASPALFGLKATYGRIPRGPRVHQTPHTVTVGCVSRSVRDTARWLDVCNGSDPRDTLSLPRVEGWEAGLGTYRDALAGKRAVIAVDLGVAVVHPRVAELVTAAAEALIADAGLARVDIVVQFPPALLEWAMSNFVTLVG